jgi:hypothetical protein
LRKVFLNTEGAQVFFFGREGEFFLFEYSGSSSANLVHLTWQYKKGLSQKVLSSSENNDFAFLKGKILLFFSTDDGNYGVLTLSKPKIPSLLFELTLFEFEVNNGKIELLEDRIQFTSIGHEDAEKTYENSFNFNYGLNDNYLLFSIGQKIYFYNFSEKVLKVVLKLKIQIDCDYSAYRDKFREIIDIQFNILSSDSFSICIVGLPRSIFYEFSYVDGTVVERKRFGIEPVIFPYHVHKFNNSYRILGREKHDISIRNSRVDFHLSAIEQSPGRAYTQISQKNKLEPIQNVFRNEDVIQSWYDRSRQIYVFLYSRKFCSVDELFHHSNYWQNYKSSNYDRKSYFGYLDTLCSSLEQGFEITSGCVGTEHGVQKTRALKEQCYLK